MADDSALPAPSSPSPTPQPTQGQAAAPKGEPNPGREGEPKAVHGALRGPGEGMNRQAKNPMAFLLLVVFLCIAGWFLVNWMNDSSRIQDCVMSGRKNCVEMDPRLGR